MLACFQYAFNDPHWSGRVRRVLGPKEKAKYLEEDFWVTPKLPRFGARKRAPLTAGVAADSGSFAMRFIFVLASAASNSNWSQKKVGSLGVTLWVRKPCNPLKSHKTAKAFFGKARYYVATGKAWRKTAEIWKSLEKKLGDGGAPPNRILPHRGAPSRARVLDRADERHRDRRVEAETAVIARSEATKQPRGRVTRPLGCFAPLTRNKRLPRCFCWRSCVWKKRRNGVDFEPKIGSELAAYQKDVSFNGTGRRPVRNSQ